MSKRIKVHVTAEAIKESRQLIEIQRTRNPAKVLAYTYSSCCPIAQAVRRQGLDQVPRILYTRAFIGDCRYRLSARAARFVQRFDRTGKAKPATFVLVEEPNEARTWPLRIVR